MPDKDKITSIFESLDKTSESPPPSKYKKKKDLPIALIITVVVIALGLALTLISIKIMNCDHLVNYYEYKKEYIQSNLSNKTEERIKKEIEELERSSKVRKDLALFTKYFIIIFIIFVFIYILLLIYDSNNGKRYMSVNMHILFLLFIVLSLIIIPILSIAISSINIENYNSEKYTNKDNEIVNRYDEFYANKKVNKTHSKQIRDMQIAMLVLDSFALFSVYFGVKKNNNS